MPVFQDLEISAGALMESWKIKPINHQYAANPKWDQMFDFAYGSKNWVRNADGTDSTLTYYWRCVQY